MTTQTLESSTATTTTLNGLDPAALKQLIDSVAADPAQGQTRWSVQTRWVDGTVSQTRVTGFEIGGQRVAKDFTITIDEPLELGGTNTQPNPQEYLLAAMNACMMVGYAAVATLMGVKLSHVEIETSGEIDLRGFLGIDPTVKPGYDGLHYTVRISGDGTEDQFRQIHQIVMATSPNRFNLASAIPLTADLVIQ